MRLALRLVCFSALAVTGISFSFPSHGFSFDEVLVEHLAQSAPRLDQAVLRQAVTASQCAVINGVAVPERLAVIDFSLPSSEERLWIFDLATGELILRDLVAHGKNSGFFRSDSFSNVEGSHQSSVGLFRGSESYYGKHGYSLRLDGLEPGFNHLARQRAIVIHGADYVSDAWVAEYGRIGRSHGCPAVDNQVVRRVVDSLKGGQLVFKYYPDQHWVERSSFLNCKAGTVAELSGVGENPG
ncbi:murein L,D-transpeptidase catalytic domain family protein [Marinobacter salinisoli]|uniref:Murein L,D-transpeptidase catalytic domain family protein n=1 Tax=Marinobacter salinisoli TaxID=2769486 RepID=A0ABX7MPA4_9GAMM|nr:murein L,D-transpeptidase catalytic domain family protein [Marinobacter salinisoli]QSP94074.1 murein L,D-transpeptidase catalytic domain family protein [Marinobacter salinisoli]